MWAAGYTECMTCTTTTAVMVNKETLQSNNA